MQRGRGTVTAERLRELLSYDPETGVFIWKVRQSRAVPIGTVAGAVKTNGRRYISVLGEALQAHRLAWFYVHGKWPDGYIRHRDEQFDHNWIANLYESTPTETNIDRRLGKNNTSGRVGVGFNTQRGKWKAWIKRDFRSVNLGWFDTFEDAVAARVAAEEQFPANISHEEFERSSHHERTRQRQRTAWKLASEQFAGDCVWENLGAFIADIGEPPGARFTVVKVNADLPLGPANFLWRAPPSVRHDMSTAAGRAARGREIYRETPDKQRRYELKKRYNLTDEEVDALIEREKGPCDLCGRHERSAEDTVPGRLSTDHDHVTDSVRGLLCGTCNSALGFLGDSVAMIVDAAIYKTRHARPGEIEEAQERLETLLALFKAHAEKARRVA